MKTTFFVLLILCGALFADWIDFGFDAVDHATITVIESTPSGMVIDVMIPGIGLTETSEDGLNFRQVSVCGQYSLHGGRRLRRVRHVRFRIPLQRSQPDLLERQTGLLHQHGSVQRVRKLFYSLSFRRDGTAGLQ
jgi:hypothetical protein